MCVSIYIQKYIFFQENIILVLPMTYVWGEHGELKCYLYKLIEPMRLLKCTVIPPFCLSLIILI